MLMIHHDLWMNKQRMDDPYSCYDSNDHLMDKHKPNNRKLDNVISISEPDVVTVVMTHMCLG